MSWLGNVQLQRLDKKHLNKIKREKCHLDTYKTKDVLIDRLLNLSLAHVPSEVIDAVRLVQPGDGDCLFHAIGYFVPANVSHLRKLVRDYITAHEHEDINGMTLKEWIRTETNMSVASYVEYMHSGWGGHLELWILARILELQIHVYEEWKESRFKLIAIVGNGSQTVRLEYFNKVHYNVLI
tara:strand:- start:1133 stop:1678 length:546 start_codon:yes stop_codon:yes gene_type:complete